jgi:DNA-binding MarR family transcriptional regulator/N-acetylglutamate synthase-like GNAT family acetyltransferase
LAQHGETTASTLGDELGIDAGYLSRILRAFHKRGLVEKKVSAADGRQTLLRLTSRGQAAFAKLNAGSRAQVGALLTALPVQAQTRLVQAMGTIEQVFGAPREPAAPYLLRPHQPGDMGWVVQRHGALYAQEYGWNGEFEALVAEIVARFVRRFDPKRERCWIADKDGENVGSVFLVKRSATVAQLRLLLVEPQARGLGLGTRLADECTRFARQVGYRKIMLWTNSVLHAARRIYERAGYRLVKQGPHHSFGQDLVEQTWELTL